MIKMQVLGNLGKDAVVGNHQGKTVINFSVAHTYKDATGNEQTTWVECSYWKENAGVAPYLVKGTKVFVEGTPSARAWEANGKHGVSLSLNVFSVELCGGQPQTAQAQQPAPQQQQQQYQQPAPQQQQYQQQPPQQQYQQPAPQQQQQQWQQPQGVPLPNQQQPWPNAGPPAQGGLPF